MSVENKIQDFTVETVDPIIENLYPDARVYILDKLEKYRSYSRMPETVREIIESLVLSD